MKADELKIFLGHCKGDEDIVLSVDGELIVSVEMVIRKDGKIILGDGLDM